MQQASDVRQSSDPHDTVWQDDNDVTTPANYTGRQESAANDPNADSNDVIKRNNASAAANLR